MYCVHMYVHACVRVCACACVRACALCALFLPECGPDWFELNKKKSVSGWHGTTIYSNIIYIRTYMYHTSHIFSRIFICDEKNVNAPMRPANFCAKRKHSLHVYIVGYN